MLHHNLDELYLRGGRSQEMWHDRWVQGCVFCSIVAGKSPAFVVLQDDGAIAILDRGQATRGHTLVVPRLHASDIWDIGIAQFQFVTALAWQVSALLKAALKPVGLNLVQSNGAQAWQEVFHFHLHVVPRYQDDGLIPPWTGRQVCESDLQNILREITATQSGALLRQRAQ